MKYILSLPEKVKHIESPTKPGHAMCREEEIERPRVHWDSEDEGKTDDPHILANIEGASMCGGCTRRVQKILDELDAIEAGG